MTEIKSSNFTKKEISKKIHSLIGFSSQYSETITNDFIEILKKLIKKKQINIKNFGKFKISFKKERVGRNPKNNKIYKISARNTLSFISSKRLNNKINE